MKNITSKLNISRMSWFKNPLIIGFIIAGILSINITLVDTLVKIMTFDLTGPQIMVFSGLFCWSALSAILTITPKNKTQHHKLYVHSKHRMLLLSRSITHAGAFWGFTMAYQNLPFFEVFIYLAVLPIISAFLEYIINDEKVAKIEAIVLTITSVVVIYLLISAESINYIGHIYGAIASIFASITLVQSRKLVLSGFSKFANLYYSCIALFILGALLGGLSFNGISQNLSGIFIPYSFSLLLNRYLAIVLGRYLPVYLSQLVVLLQFLWMYLISSLFFHEFIDPVILFCSMILAFSGIVAILFRPRTVNS